MPSPSAFRPSAPAWLACLCCTVVVTLSGCGNDEEPAPPPPRIVLVENVQEAHPGPQTLRFAGVVESVTTTQLAFQVAGRVERILVDEGTRVTRGQALADLDTTDYELQLRDASARQQQLHADLVRKRKLLAEGILAPAAIEPLEAALVSAQVARDTAARQIEYGQLTAPFDGVVAQRLVEPDMVVDAGTPILRMQDNQHIEVSVDLPESAALTVPLGPELKAQGQLVLADEVTLPLEYREHSTQPRDGARTYRLVLRGNPPADYNLLPGMAMRVSLQRPAPEPRDDSYLLPISALQAGPDDQHHVWLAVDGHARRQPVQLQGIEADRAQVTGPFEADAAVVVAGGSKLSEGQPIKTRQRN
ncbi:RND family efflux transporter, MFP subunit [Halopseudomonas litoralis]|uniref:RND family efflux transporter, MFP subunit n=1 Tax=Halopseudomonas litoralis TaxID=797277 RepID=A0A1H1REW9_9GAMM|nr:efflux RND transporter periplasmic adaptor subunit [Halopseudomonas litoralis]SDS34248.1 RND family efflux transporter, MFP subunit [Halopseudomonas litoralis]